MEALSTATASVYFYILNGLSSKLKDSSIKDVLELLKVNFNSMGDSMKMGNTFWPNLAMKT